MEGNNDVRLATAQAGSRRAGRGSRGARSSRTAQTVRSPGYLGKHGLAGAAPGGGGRGQGGARRWLASAWAGILGGEDQGGLCGPVWFARTKGASGDELDQLHPSPGPPAVSGGSYRGGADRRGERCP